MSSNELRSKALREPPHNGPAGMFESLEPRLMLTAAPVFETDLADYYALNGDGKGLTIGIDGFDADGDPLTIDVAASDPTGLRWEVFDQSTSANHYAVMHYTQDDGTPIGDIVVQLFEGRSPLATERFITLATHDVDAEGNLIPAGPGVDPWYTDVVVHRVIDGFMFQCGDAVNGDGTGDTPLDEFPNEIDPDLSFLGRGVLGLANRGPDTNDGQWFITDGIASWLDGDYTIFGQVIAGWDVYETIITSETDENDRPLDPPLLSGVDIIDSSADGTITLVADETFTGPVDLTITLSDTGGNEVSRVVTIMPEPVLGDMAPGHTTPDTTLTLPLDLTFADGDLPLTFETVHNYAGDGEVALNVEAGGVPGEYVLQISVPPEYDKSTFDVSVYAYMDQFDNLVSPNDRMLPLWSSFTEVAVHGVPNVAVTGDVATYPGGPVDTTFTVEYGGGVELDVALSTVGYPGGELDLTGALTAPTQPGDPYTVHFDLPADWDGTPFDVEISVTELGGTSPLSTGSFEVAVAMPTFDLPDDVHVVPGETLRWEAVIDNPSGQPLEVEMVTAGYPGGELDLSSAVTPPAQAGDPYVFEFDLPADWDGTAFEVRASAQLVGVTGVEPTMEAVDVALNAVPQIAPLDELHVPSGETRTIQATVTDADGDDLTVYVSADHAGAEVSIDPDTYVVTVTSPAGYTGAFDVTIAAIETRYDGKGLVEETLETFTVITDLRPTIAEDRVIHLNVDQATQLPLTITDPEGETTEFTTAVLAKSHPGAVVEIDADHVLSITPPAGFAGAFSFTVSVIETDYIGTFDPAEVTFYVSTLAASPSVNPVADRPARLVETTDVPFTVDFDGSQELTVTADSDYAGPGDVTLSITAPAAAGEPYLLSVDLPAEYDGSTFAVTIQATVAGFEDAVGVGETSFEIEDDAAPTISSIGLVTTAPNTATTRQVQIVDSDTDETDLRVTVEADHPDATVSYDDGVLTIIPPDWFVGVFGVTLSVVEAEYEDLDGAATIETFAVSTLEDEPSIEAVDDQVISPLEPDPSIPFTVDYDGAQAMTVSAETTYDGPGTIGISFDEPDDGSGGDYTLHLDMPDDYDGSEFTVTLTAAVDGYATLAKDTASFTVKANARPVLLNDPVIRGRQGQTQVVKLSAADEDDPDAEFVFGVAGEVPAGWVVDVINHDELTITPSADFTGVQPVVVTVVEDAYKDAPGVEPAEMTFYFSTTTGPTFGEIHLDDLDDYPGKVIDISVPITYDGDPDLVVKAVSDDYDDGGTLNLDGAVTAPAQAGDPYTLTFTIPDDYSGGQFTVTVKARTADMPEDVWLNEIDLAFSGGDRPTLEDPGIQSAVGGEETVVRIPINDGDDDDDEPGPFTPYVVGEVDWAIVTAEIDPDDPSVMLVRITPDAETSGTLTITLSVIETALATAMDDPADVATQLELDVVVMSADEMPAISPIDDLDLKPGRGQNVTFSADYDGEGDLAFDVTHESDNDGAAEAIELGELVHNAWAGTWTFRVTADDDYNGLPVTVTVTPSIDGTPVTGVAETFEVGYGSRPEITHVDGVEVPDAEDDYVTIAVAAGRTVTLPLTIEDDETSAEDIVVRAGSASRWVIPSVAFNAETGEHDLTLTISENATGPVRITVGTIETEHLNEAVEGSLMEFRLQIVSVPTLDAVALDPTTQDVTVPFEVAYEGDDALVFEISTNYAGPGEIGLAVTPPAEDGGDYTLAVTLPGDYDASDFDVILGAAADGATINGQPMAPATATFTFRASPQIVDPGSQVMTDDPLVIPLTITAFDSDVLTVEYPAGVTAEITPAADGAAHTHDLTVTVPDGFNDAFDVTITATRTFYNDATAATAVTIPVATGLYLLSHLPDEVVLPADGEGITFGLDGWAPDGAAISYTVTPAHPWLVWAHLPEAGANRYAELAFVDEDGQIGTIVVELFDDRYADLPEDVESPVERFVTLATQTIRQTGYDMDADKPVYDEFGQGDPGYTDPFYTDVKVHRIIPGFMFQTGDAREGDGSGWTGMGPIEDNFGPDAFRSGNLSFAGRGVLALANTGPGTSDGQFFITDAPTPHLDELHPIFGQVVSGWDVYDAIINRPTGDGDVPENMPVLSGVTIVDPGQYNQDTTLTLNARRRFKGSTTVTVSMSAGDEVIEKDITVRRATGQDEVPSFGAVYEITAGAGQTVWVPLSAGIRYQPPTTDYRGPGRVDVDILYNPEGDGYLVELDLPDGYNGSDFTVTVGTATIEIHAADGKAFVFGDNSVVVPAIDGEPGTVHRRAFALDVEDLDQADVTIDHDYVGNGDIDAEIVRESGHYVLNVVLPRTYDGSAFNLYLRSGFQAATGLQPGELIVPVRFASRPTIGDPGLISVPPGGGDRVPLEITVDGDVELTVAVDTGGDPNVTAEIIETFDPNTAQPRYALDVQMAPGYEGIVKLIVTAVETDRLAKHPDLALFERVVYVSTLRERPEIDQEEDGFLPLDGRDKTFTLSITDDSTLDRVYEISTSTPRVVAEWVGPPAGPQALGDAATEEFRITAPENYFGAFTVTVTAVEDHAFSEEALEATTYVLTVTVPDDGGTPTIVSQSHLNLDDDGALATAVVSDGDWMYVGASIRRNQQGKTLSSDLYIYDMSDPDDPALVDSYDGFQGTAGAIEVVHRLIDGRTRTIVLIAANEGGLRSLLLDDDGRIEADGRVSSIVARDVAVKGNIAYVAAAAAGLMTYDFSDPTDLVELDAFRAFAPTEKTRMKYGNFPQHQALWTYYFSDAVAVEIRGNQAFVAERHGQSVTGYNFRGQIVPRNPSTKGWIGVINIANPANLKRGTMALTRSEVTDLDLQGTRLFLAATDGLKSYRVGGPGAPRPIGGFKSDEAIASVEVVNNVALATVEGGYRRIDVSNPRRPIDGGMFWVDIASWSNEQTPDNSLWLETAAGVPDGTDVHLPISGAGVLGFDGGDLAPEDRLNTGATRVWVDNLPVVIRLVGPGSFDVHFDGFAPVIDSLEVNGTDASSSLIIATPGVTIREINVNGSLKALVGRTTTLTGDLTIDGSVRRLVLGDVGEEGRRVEQALTLGAGDAPDATIILGEVHNADLHSDTRIRALSAIRWMDNEAAGMDDAGQPIVDPADVLSAPSIGRFVIRGRGRAVAGDFQADVQLDNDGVHVPGTVVLGPTVIRGDVDESRWQINGDAPRIVVGGDVDESRWRIHGETRGIFVSGALRDSRVLATGSVGRVVLGGMIHSDLFAGYEPAMTDPEAVTGLPSVQEVADHFDALGSIGALIVRGLGRGVDHSFADSNIAAGEVGAAVLRFGDLDNNGDPFGLAAHDVRRLAYGDQSRRDRWVGDGFPAEDDSPRQLGDLIVRIV